MIQSIPTWAVYFRDGEKDWRLRVPQTVLPEFVSVLIFNGVPMWKAEREPTMSERLEAQRS